MNQTVSSITVSILLAISVAPAFAADKSQPPGIGDPAPAWKFVPGTDGQLHSLKDYDNAEVVVVAFLCNKCPCVTGYENRFRRLVEAYGDRVRFVGINSTPGDIESLDIMKQRVQSGRLNYDYLKDESQTVGRSFGATSTPHVFLLDRQRNVAYAGAFDDNRDERLVKHHYVLNALNELLTGKEVTVKKTAQFGCTITYQ